MAILNGGGAYGVKTVVSDSRKGNASVVSLETAISMMLGFGMFTIALISLIVAIINSTKK